MAWQRLNADEFELLMERIFRAAPEYRNVRRLMNVNAADRGCDLSADRYITDSLGRTVMERVIVQAKHYRSRSVNATEISDVLVRISLWEPPPVRTLIFATSGTYTLDAVQWADRHNHTGRLPLIDLWSRGDLEAVLADKPEIVDEFGLR